MNMMKMYFHFGFGDQFLFEKLHIDNTFKMWLVCTVLFVITLIYEMVKYVRCVHCGCQKTHCTGSDNGETLQDETNRIAVNNCYVGRLRTQRHRLVQTVLHTIQTALGFILMLSVMSFNLCIIFAIIVGK